MNPWILAIAVSLGFGSAWGIQSLRWAASDLDSEARTKADIAKQVNAVNDQLIASQAATERYRIEYLEYQQNAKTEIDDLERRVTAGPERLYIKAKCPAVPTTGADAGRAASGAAELDATATGYYLALERGLANQYGLLQLCRTELKKRSAQ